ncbi:FecR domain-containing protein [Hymenobacter sp. BT507]|uniref:FecR domain-containing protein n=1 Tax=Hymenobacter citatus TaxID=2763506 RepID=A0ABR7MN59_9BACT|nr:FecR domain-containing protein [Hymenobacter citatus]MBC6612495.1 FecR domain-containing protein [Hymenobacter citatus]
MLPLVTQELFNRYVHDQATPAEASAVRAWLTEPTNQLVAEQWMRAHWHTLETEPATALHDEPDYEALLTSLHQQMGRTAAWRWQPWAAAAAIVGGLAVGGLWWQYGTPSTTPVAAVAHTETTAYGQKRTLHLSDGTEVTLNGHSTLRYPQAWATGQPREVWLDGEAYFSVRHLPSDEHFIVHTPDGMQVEVLGTKFAVYRRQEQARVMLVSGKVQLKFKAADHRPDLVMQPGELVEMNSRQPEAAVRKTTVAAAPYTSWKDGKLVFDETTIAELATRLHDTYGVEVVLATPELQNRRITGTVPIGELDVLLQALEETFHLTIQRQQNRLIFSDHNSPKPSL